MAGIYIHVPFCKQACSYCNFYFMTRNELRQPFVDALISEIQSHGEGPFSDETVETIYFGGGTPSLLTPGQLESILSALHTAFDLSSKETTIELNPDDVSERYLQSLKTLGFNRVSMGVQSFDPDLLAFMNRSHTAEEAEIALSLIQSTGFPCYTADVIFGNPGQSVEDLERDIDRLLRFDPPHVSAYSLTIEPNTRLGKQVELGRIEPPQDDELEKHFDLVEERLREAGLNRYEVSNFARPGREAVHNSNYWKHVNYLGLGPSAHSLLWTQNGARRWRNRPDVKFYLDRSWHEVKEEVEELNLDTLAEERLMLGLRTIAGISVEQMASRYGYSFTPQQWEWLRLQSARGCVSISGDGDSITLTGAGLKIADYIALELISRGES
ncbi:MAG: radical SAM family heme chaperone HemW [Bacteroidetes bacterium]|jgi:oxygen-independent coproporphyrinogen-3 oxidase|nr:radical SAM family heme chaperone HemW [Bacteroidota bacterium]